MNIPKKKWNKLDTQLFPECEGTWCDRDIVKKTVNKRKKSKKVSFNLKNHIKTALVGHTVEKENTRAIYKVNDKYFIDLSTALDIFPDSDPQEINALITYYFYKCSPRELDYPGDKPSVEIKSIYDIDNKIEVNTDNFIDMEVLAHNIMEAERHNGGVKTAGLEDWGDPTTADYSDPIHDQRGRLIITRDMLAEFPNWTEYMKETYEREFEAWYEEDGSPEDVKHAEEIALDKVRIMIAYHAESKESDAKSSDKISTKILENLNKTFKRENKDYTAHQINYNLENKTFTFLCYIPQESGGSIVWQCQALFDQNFKPYGIEFMSIINGQG